jgi:hypothetical protein
MANIFSQFMAPPKSVGEFGAEMQQAQGNKLALAFKRMQQQQAEQGMADDQAMRSAYSTSGGDQGKYRNALVNAGNYKAVQALDATALTNRKTNADIGKTGVETSKLEQEVVSKALDNAKPFAAQIQDASGAEAYVRGLYNDPVLGKYAAAMKPIEQALQEIPQDPAQLQRWKAGHMQIDGAKLIEMSAPKMQTMNAGDRHVTQGVDQFTGQVMPGTERSTPIMQSADNLASNQRAMAEGAASRSVQMRGQDLTRQNSLDRMNLDNQNLVMESGGPGQVALSRQFGKSPAGWRWKQDGSQEAIPGGPADMKNSAGAVAKVTDAKDVLALLDQAEPLLDDSTNSYAGVALDEAARAVGGATKGAKAAAQLRTLEGALISKMPKMSGPQSDKDVLLYKQMAGQIGDRTIPAEQKRAAIKTIREINERHAGGGKPQRTVVRTGKSGGRKVIEYSDGAVEYAD